MNRQIKVLFSADQIASRVAELGLEITEFYRGSELTVVALANGAIPFAADLIRKISLPLFVDSIAVSSYQENHRENEMCFRSELKLDPAGRRILLVDEVLDSGRTLMKAAEYCRKRGAADVRTAVMITKNARHAEDGLRQADWTGFEAPDDYLFGYGLDFNELYRNLPFIGTMD